MGKLLHARKRESCNNIRRMTAFPRWSLHLSLTLSKRYDEYICLRRTRRACARLRALLQRSTGPASSISRRDLDKVQQNSLLAILGNSIPGNDFTPRITRLYAISTTLTFSRLSARSRTEISPIIIQLQFATGQRLDDQATFVNMTLNKLNKSCRSYLNRKFNNLFSTHVFESSETLTDLKRCIAMRGIKREISPREII